VADQPQSFAAETGMVFEVLSKSTGWIDQSLKLRDYDATPTIRTYVLISQDELRATVRTRDAAGRLGIQSAALLEGADAYFDQSTWCPSSDGARCEVGINLSHPLILMPQ
jgi:hypothetical protein